MAKAAPAARFSLVSAFVAALGVAPAAAQWTAWFTVTNPANRVASGSDFFSTVANDPLDYANQADRRNSGFEDTGLTGSLVNGQYAFQTTTDDPNIWLWYPGSRGAYPDEGTGARLPINADAFSIFTVQMTCSNCPTPTGGNRVGANIHFYRGPQASEFVITTVNFAVHPGTNIYSIDLRNLAAGATAFVGSMAAPGNWSGTIQGLRFDPADRTGMNMSIDWVTLSAPNSSSATIDWGSFTGSAKIRLFPSNPAGTAPDTTARIGVSKSLCFDGPSCGLSFSLFDFVEPAQPVSGLQTIDTTILGPGTYWIRALSATGNTIPGTTDQKIVVNTIPSLTLTQPDARGDEGSLGTQQGMNYPFAYRNGHDAWDFTQPNDFEVSGGPDEYGVLSIVANPSTQCGGVTVTPPACNSGVLSGNWFLLDNAAPPTQQPQDVQFFPRMGGAPIDSTRYRHLTMKMLLDRPKDREPDGSPGQAGTGNLGAVSRILWFDKKVLGPGDTEKLNISEDIYIQNGVQEIHVDLYRIRVDPGSNGKVPWSQAGLVRYFRIDPHEYVTQTDAYYDEILLTTNDKSANGQYTISWSNSDPEGDAVTITSIALDPDVCGPLPSTGQFGPIGVHCPTQNGNELVIAGAGCTFGGGCTAAPPNTGGFVFNSGAFTAAQVPSGTYWVLIGYSDGRNTAFRYSSGPLDVDRLPPPAQVPMFRLYSVSQDYHFFTINPLSRNFAISIGFQDESNPVPFRVENTPTAGSLPLFRMFNPNRGVHFYIGGDEGQRDFNMFLGALYESNEGYLYPLGSGPNPCSGSSGTTEMFRLYNNNSGLHLYTASAQQKDGILALFAGIWVQHSSVGCVYP